MTARITIVGVGDDGLAGIAPDARRAVESATIVVSSTRLLDKLTSDITAERIAWPTPFDPLADTLRQLSDDVSAAVLVTGDPLWYGVGSVLLRHFNQDQITVFPHVSAFSLAAARLGWALQDVATVSLHGRPTALIEPFIQPTQRIIALTGSFDDTRDVCARLCRRGFADSQVWVLEHMGNAAEKLWNFPASAFPKGEISPFHTLAVACVAGPDATVLSRAPGLPDDAFEHDGQLTKRDVRAVSVGALMPRDGAQLWDVGAGCGSISIEWLRLFPNARATAFEPDADRCAMIRTNMDRLGAPQLELVEGTAPACLAGHEAPDAIFIGGGLGDAGVFETCWQALRHGGRLVANAVTLEGETRLAGLHKMHGGELVRIEISRAIELGTLRGMQPRMAVTQWRVGKP